MSHSVSNVGRTAFDSFKAKHSAICGAAYPVLSPFPVERQPAAPDGHDYYLEDHDVAGLEDSYRQLLDAMSDRLEGMGLGPGRTRRQTPLVNAGYAMRAATILSTILNFVRYHDELDYYLDDGCGSEEEGRPSLAEIQIVVLGAGLDVTGLWSMMVAPGPSSIAVRVVEVDTHEICSIKGSAIKEMEQLAVTKSGIPTPASLPKSQDGFVLSAVPRNNNGTCTCGDKAPTSSYVLLELDLAESLEAVERVLSKWLKVDVPTLLVSELVLAYLGDAPVDRLLRWVKDAYVQKVESSALIAFEPLGPCESGPPNKAQEVPTIEDSYRASYYQQFTSKMGRGNHQSDHEEEEEKKARNASLFRPVGSSCRDVESRLQRLGYANVHACLAGAAVGSLFPREGWTSREAFDEHAALALHVRSYVVMCGFGSQSTPAIRQLLCPWIAGGCPPVLRSVPASVDGRMTRRVWLSKVNHREEEESIRRLFLETYRDVSAAHASIRKMVKAALKTDLAISPVGSSSTEAQSSLIHSHYQRNGGVFLLAKSWGDDQVVGAIGIRRLRCDEVQARGLSASSDVFEIHRLMVDASARRQRIGTLLLERAKELIVQWFRVSSDSFHLVATTPALLEGANRFYASRGFSSAQSKTIGELRMVTHVAHVPCFIMYYSK